jgi:hypothetical protein
MSDILIEILELLSADDNREYTISLLSIDIPEIINKNNITVISNATNISIDRLNYILDNSNSYKDCKQFLSSV